MVANGSGGPKEDIVRHGQNGFLALTADEYAEAFHTIVQMSDAERMRTRTEARQDTDRFKQDVYARQLARHLQQAMEQL